MSASALRLAPAGVRAPPPPPSGDAPGVREYLYFVDVHGQLFLDDTVPKNIATCFKDKRFLDFFFSRLRANPPSNPLFAAGFEYVSPCGKEMNYVRAADAPIVFHDLDSQGLLWFAGSKTHPFDPSQIFVSRGNGYFYHPLPAGSPLPTPTRLAALDTPLGLIKSSAVLSHLASGADMESGTVTLHGRSYKINFIE
nr:hypothetical protein HK105_007086 [Polyrhizophydium stewartii]